MEELDLTGMTWYGALVAIILMIMAAVSGRRHRFDTRGRTRSEIQHMVHEAVHSERDRAVVLRRLTDGVRMEQLAEEFSLSVPQVKRMVYRAEDALAKMR